jgi:hypothetical protein
MKIVGAYTDGTLIRSKDEIDPDYYCVSVEHTDYRPVLFEEVIQKIKDQGGQVGFRQGNGPAID